MIKVILGLSFFLLSSCSTLEKEVVTCPNTSSPKGAEEIVVKSENGLPVYMGLRGVELYCTNSGTDIDMEASVNIRALRNNIIDNDYVPITISLVSVDINNKEYDRDEFSYSQFLLKGNKIIERSTNMGIDVPKNGKVYIGIR
jgi:hypothetical protein|tara:strand:- start:662 stop:1090 length:429 start_codon:yes stop_codon:yes gene_type:complete